MRAQSTSVFKLFEQEVIRLLGEGKISDEMIEKICSFNGEVKFEHTGVGYFLTIQTDYLPQERLVLSEPSVTGVFEDRLIGFVIFLEGKELLFECYGYGCNLLEGLPENIREQNIRVSAES